jgi:hypothetical protein
MLDTVYNYDRQSLWDIENRTNTKRGERKIDWLIEDFSHWRPDLIINDLEPATYFIAKTLDIPIWSCSLFGLRNFVKTENKTPYIIKNMKLFLARDFDKKLIYSFAGNLPDAPDIGEYEWVMPDIDSYKSNITDGESNIISDILFAQRPALVKGNFKYLDSIYNAFLVEHFKVGMNIGRNEEYLEESEDVEFSVPAFIPGQTLAEKIDEYCT